MTTTTPTTTTTSDAKAPPNPHVRAALNQHYREIAKGLALLANEQIDGLRALLKTMEKTKDSETAIKNLRAWFEAHGVHRPDTGEEHITEHNLKWFNEMRAQLGPFASATTAQAFEALKKAMHDDPEYAWGWQCNLAVPIMDSSSLGHALANKSAAHLMRHIFDVDMTAHEHYPATQKVDDSQAIQIDPAAEPVMVEHKLYTEKASEVRTLLSELYDECKDGGNVFAHLTFGQLCDVMNLLDPTPSPMPAPVNIGIDLGREHGADDGLPEDPEPEGTADDLRPLIESPARRLTLTFTHPTIGDGVFTTELLKAIGEFTLYMAKAELPEGPYDAVPEPRYPFTASNGVVVDVLAWKTVDDMGGLPSAPFMTGEEQLDHMTATIREAAQAMEGLHGVGAANGKGILMAMAERITGIHSAVEAGVKDVSQAPASISVAMVRGEAAAPRAVVRDLTQETQVEPSSNRGVQGVGDSPTRVAMDYNFEKFMAYGRVQLSKKYAAVPDIPWSFQFHGHAVTHENDSRYLIEGNTAGADMLIFNRSDTLTVDELGRISIKSPSTPDALELSDISAQALDTLKVPMSVAAQPDIIKPTIGRRVWFWQARNSGGTGFVCHDIAVPMDAGIVFVHSDRCVNLDVCDHAGNHHAFTSVYLDQGDDCPRDPDAARCEWMPYQKGQASKGSK